MWCSMLWHPSTPLKPLAHQQTPPAVTMLWTTCQFKQKEHQPIDQSGTLNHKPPFLMLTCTTSLGSKQVWGRKIALNIYHVETNKSEWYTLTELAKTFNKCVSLLSERPWGPNGNHTGTPVGPWLFIQRSKIWSGHMWPPSRNLEGPLAACSPWRWPIEGYSALPTTRWYRLMIANEWLFNPQLYTINNGSYIFNCLVSIQSMLVLKMVNQIITSWKITKLKARFFVSHHCQRSGKHLERKWLTCS